MSLKSLGKYVNETSRSLDENSLSDLAKGYSELFRQRLPVAVSLLATVVWQIIRRTDEYQESLKQYSRLERELVVPFDQRFDMAVTVPERPHSDRNVVVIDLKIARRSAVVALRRWNQFVDQCWLRR